MDDTRLDVLYEKGITFFNSEKIPEAEKCFREMLEIDPKCSPALNNLGVAAYRQNRKTDAESLFQKACEADPENLEAAANLGDLYFDSSVYRKAEKLYAFLSQKLPDNAELYLKLGDCYIVFAAYNNAYAHYKKAAELEPGNEAVQQRLQLTASALMPVPFAISRFPENAPVLVAAGKGLDNLAAVFDVNGFEIIHAGDGFDFSKYYFEPADIVILKDDYTPFEEEIPALCRIFIPGDINEIISGASPILNRNIDYVLCSSEEQKAKLINNNIFADYQVIVMDLSEKHVRENPKELRERFIEFLAEMVLFYAQRHELRDCHEQAFWLLEKAVRGLGHIPDITKRFEQVRKTVDHLSDPDLYSDLYKESAEMSIPLHDVKNLKRYAWLLGRLKAAPGNNSIADVGCHKGEFCFALAEAGFKMTGIDIAEKNITDAKKSVSSFENDNISVEFFVSPADKIDNVFPADTFDAAMLMEILEHVSSVEDVLSSVDNIVKPGGFVYITVPDTHLEMICNLIFNKVRDFPEHVRRFNKDNIPVYFRGKEALHVEEIVADAGIEEQTWYGISYKVT